MSRNAPINLTKLRYVLYARKSTEDESRQVRSIDDQIKDCKKLAYDQGLNVIEIIKESKSAKKPGQRQLFTKMLKDIEAKKYDAILCWHPDRLCRNMLEGGQIINMLDEGTLSDIRFNSHQFSNDANGKMLLGMLFVFSKQYSDDLSDKVNRCIGGNLEEGKSAGAPKLGYDRSEVTGYYEPSKYFDVVKQAWSMRKEGDSLETVTAYLSEHRVHRVTKNLKKQRMVVPSKSTVSNMFHDPIYYGVLIQADQTVNLCEITNFKPMIDKATYDYVQALGYNRTQRPIGKDRKIFYPLRGMVFCAICNSPKYMGPGKNKSGSGVHVLSYRCNNKECNRYPKSLRARHIFNSIYELLEGLKLSDDGYKRYSEELDGYTDERVVAIKQDIYSKRGRLAHIKSEINERSLSVGRLTEKSPAYQPNINALEDLTDQQIELNQQIAALEEKIANPSKIKLSKEEFLNLVKSASDKMKAGSAVEKDVLCRILFLNLYVNNEKLDFCTWREPFASLVKSIEIQPGGAGRNRTYYQVVMSRLL